jgi:hypothetical protein
MSYWSSRHGGACICGVRTILGSRCGEQYELCVCWCVIGWVSSRNESSMMRSWSTTPMSVSTESFGNSESVASLAAAAVLHFLT